MATTGYLSKSLFIRGRQCLKSLWLHRNRPELRDATPPALEKIFSQGTEVGILAQKLFPGGVEVPYDGLTYEEQTDRTRALIREGISTIYEATFRQNGIFIKVDILHYGRYGWEIYEVKSSTQVKPVFIFDAALQYHVVAAAGLPVSRVSIITLNNKYTRYGALNLERLFSSHDITDKAEELQPIVIEELERQREILQGEMPAIGIGHHCDKPYSCDFKGYCWQNIPEDSVFDIAGRGIDPFTFYRQGIIRQSDVPLSRLNRSQRLQVEGTLQQKDSINKPSIWKFCNSLFYPLCFLDFETYMEAVPTSDGCRPYQQIPFQFSLHIQHQPDAVIEHHAFLGASGADPRAALTEYLMSVLPENPCIIAWHQSFEIGVLKELAQLFPHQSQRITAMIPGFRDLMQPFKSRAVYLWQSNGSASLKTILPLMVPELTYDGMEISNGGQAMDAWPRMAAAESAEELEVIRKALLDYCHLDTLAMVRILDKLKEMGL